jgi:hypothetical protein
MNEKAQRLLEEDMIILQEMKSRYYKMYFKLAKQEKSMLD